VIARVVQVAGFLTVMLLGGFMVVMFRRDAKQDGNQDSGTKVNG